MIHIGECHPSVSVLHMIHIGECHLSVSGLHMIHIRECHPSVRVLHMIHIGECYPSVSVLHMIHIGKQTTDSDLSGGLLEEERLHHGRRDGAECRDQQQQPAEPGRLAGEARSQVVTENALSLVLEHLHRPGVGQTRRLCRNTGHGQVTGQVTVRLPPGHGQVTWSGARSGLSALFGPGEVRAYPGDCVGVKGSY